jgi:hypothetical protein
MAFKIFIIVFVLLLLIVAGLFWAVLGGHAEAVKWLCLAFWIALVALVLTPQLDDL